MSQKFTRWLRKKGLPSDYTVRAETRGETHSQRGDAVINASGTAVINASGAAHTDTRSADVIIESNPDPLRRRFVDLRKKAPIVRLLKWAWHRRPGRPLTSEEIAAKEREVALKELHKTLLDESKVVERLITQSLTRLGYCYQYRRSNKLKQVRFSDIALEKDALHLRVDTRPSVFPPDVNIMRLADEETLFNLAMTLGKEIDARFDERFGFWYIISRSSGVRGIPDHVQLSEMLKSFPESADGLTLPLGMAANGKLIYRTLSNMYSMLVGGTIGAGKSNILNVMICSLIRRNTAERLKLSMIDLKGGLEFTDYEGIPHLAINRDVTKTGIIEHREDVPFLLDWIIDEGEKRMNKIKREGVRNIGRYNQKHRKNPMPHWCLFIDEYADTRLSGEKGEIEKKLTNIAQRFRAVGIHVVACTQYPSAKVISQDIKIALPAQLAFNCTNRYASQAIIGDGRAQGLQPVGRYIFNWAEGGIAIQAPYITDQFIKDTVRGAISGEFEDVQETHDVTPLEIMTWALEHDSGWLSRDKIYQVFRGRGLPRAELSQWMAEWESQEFMIGTTVYTVHPPAGNRARRLIPLDGDDSDND